MTWFEYEDRVGAGWRLSLVGGAPDERTVAEALLRLHPEASDLSPTAENLSDVATEARIAYHRDCARSGGKTGSCCDFFVFQRPPGSLERSTDDRYLLQVENGCRHYSGCLQGAAQALGMEPMSEVIRTGSYPGWIPQLAEDVLAPYTAPCRIAARTITEHGFKCAEQ